MRIKLEASVENRCVAEMKALGWLGRKMNGMGYKSWPDRLFIPPKKKPKLKPFWVEFKRLGQKPTALQALMHEDLRSRGETVYVIDNYEDFTRILDCCC